jgi:hypothetical protein
VSVYKSMFRVQLGGRHGVGLRSKLWERYRGMDWDPEPSSTLDTLSSRKDIKRALA